MTLLDGGKVSGWVQAMWSVIEEKLSSGIGRDGILLTTKEGSQSILAGVIGCLFTGELCFPDISLVGEYLKFADYLQVCSLPVSPFEHLEHELCPAAASLC